MPVEFAAVVRVDNTVALFDEVDEFAGCAPGMERRTVVRTPYERPGDASREEWVSL